MTAPRRSRPSRSRSSTDVDPWAPGGSMSESLPPAPDFDFDQPETAPTTSSSRVRRRRVAGGLAAVVALGSAAIVVFDVVADQAVDTPASTTSTGSILGPETTSVPALRPGVLRSASPRVEFIDVPASLRSIGPTEVVALSPELGLVEVSLPSGRVRTTSLPFFAGQARLATTDFGAVVWRSTETTNGMPGYTVVATGAEPRSASGETGPGDVFSTPGRDEFVVWPSDGDEPAAIRSIDATGIVEFGSIPLDAERPRSMDPNGNLLFQTRDGVVATSRSGSVNVSTGDLVAVGRNHVVVNECRDDRTCFLATYDIDGRRTLGAETTRLPPDHPYRTAVPDGLAPDGGAFLAVSNADRRLVIVSVADGSTQAVYASPTFPLHAAWSSDSSGVFFSDGSVRFFRRDDDSVTVLSESLPSVRAVTARAPRQSVVCEFASAVDERLDRMRASGDLGAPSARAFDGLRTSGPPELAADTADLVAFATAFVSPEWAGSGQVENWPADVRAGVAAIADFTRTECN